MLNNQKQYLIIIKIIHSYQKKKKKKKKKCNKLICDIQEKCVDDIRVIKQELNDELILKAVHKVIQFNQKAWMKPHIDMNTEYRKKARQKQKLMSLYILAHQY